MANATLVRQRQEMSAKKSADVNVRINAEAARLARMVSSFEEKSISDVISDIVIPILKRRYEDHIKRANQEIASESKPPKR